MKNMILKSRKKMSSNIYSNENKKDTIREKLVFSEVGLGHLDFASQGLLVNIRSAFSIRKMSILTGKAILFSNKNVGIEGNISG